MQKYLSKKFIKEFRADASPNRSQSEKAALQGGQGRAGDGVAVEGGVQVEEDAGVSGGVQRGAADTGGSGRAAASDLEVDALGIGLGAVGVASRVQGEDLVAEDVVAGGQVAGDVDGPGVAVADQVVRGPVAGVGARVEAGLADLGKGERALVDRGKVARDGGQVVDDGAVVRVGPGVPLQGHRAAGGNGDGVANGRRALVADDVGAAKGVGGNEAVVLVGGGPAD
jgi:hypothetical protein